jgi:chromosome segregation ATPase
MGSSRALQDYELIAQELSGLSEKVSRLGDKISGFEKRMAEIEQVNARLEDAALRTARALQEISGHWDAVYEAMRRREVSQEASEGYDTGR